MSEPPKLTLVQQLRNSRSGQPPYHHLEGWVAHFFAQYPAEPERAARLALDAWMDDAHAADERRSAFVETGETQALAALLGVDAAYDPETQQWRQPPEAGG